jgi:hypothetical protein
MVLPIILGAALLYLWIYFSNVARVGHERALNRAVPAVAIMLISLLLAAS